MRSFAVVLAMLAAPAAEYERPLTVDAPGLSAVTLDRHVYEAARADLGDLRIVDSDGAAVPYVLYRRPQQTRSERRPIMRNRGHDRDGSASVVLDFGERFSKDRLVLRTAGDNFRRRVRVEGSDDGTGWSVIVDDAWVFAIPGPEAVRYESLALPENDFPLLRVIVQPGARERMRVEILEAWVPAGEPGDWPEETLSPRWSRASEARPGETWLTLDLGARRQPFEAVVLEAEDERFFREVATEIRSDVLPIPKDGPAGYPQWDPLGRGVIFRFEVAGELRERLRVEARGRARGLRLKIRNGDDRPLTISGVRLKVPVERLVFEADAGEEYRLTYGAPDLGPPEYDLARTLGRAPEAIPADLGAPVRRRVEADVLPWSERHPRLLWIGLLVVVAALAFVTWRSLRTV